MAPATPCSSQAIPINNALELSTLISLNGLGNDKCNLIFLTVHLDASKRPVLGECATL
jgi:hypothetical protein